MFQLHKGKNVEKAIEKVRRNLGPEWKEFSEEDIHLLERLLGEIWVNMDAKKWENLPFASMKKEDVKRLIGVGKYSDLEKMSHQSVIEGLEKVFLTVS
jgi:hypothetical protein